jgi:hypothetical protein
VHRLEALPVGGTKEELDGPIVGTLPRAQLEGRDPVGGRELRTEGAWNIRKLVPASDVTAVHARHDLAGTIGGRSNVLKLNRELAQAPIGDRGQA